MGLYFDNEPSREAHSYQVDRYNRSCKGKYIVCESREDDSTRLFIHRLSNMMDAYSKNGWWDTFTISKKPCKKGIWICKIYEFRLDRNNYINCVVFPLYYLGEDVDFDSIAWDIFYMSGVFAAVYTKSHYSDRFNTAELIRRYEKEIEYLHGTIDSTTVGRYFLSKYVNREISLKDIEDALNTKYDIERLAEELNKSVSMKLDTFKEYPLVKKKLPTDPDFTGCYTTPNTVAWLQRKCYEYDRLKLGDSEEVLEKVESAIKYWEEKRAKEKEERRQKRKKRKEEKYENQIHSEV